MACLKKERMVLTETDLKNRARWVRRETLLLHRREPGTRLASSLSCVEIFVQLYYGGFLKYGRLSDEGRDRIFVSKGHGSICLYPILSDLGFFPKDELERIGKPGSILGTIPDIGIPGYESINGSLGLGLGVACGTALALRHKGSSSKVFVVCGDGEMNEGSVWEAAMFAAKHKLSNLILIVDDNKISMLDYQRDIMGLSPLRPKFETFNWEVQEVDGHDFAALGRALEKASNGPGEKPRLILAETVKGKGVPSLEGDILCHVRSLSANDVDELLRGESYRVQ